MDLGSKDDTIPIGISLIIVAVFMCGALLSRLMVYALPLFLALLAGTIAFKAGSGIFATLADAAFAATFLLAVAQLTLAFVRSDLTWAVIVLGFAAPAAHAGYHAEPGIAAATMPKCAWQLVVSLLGAALVAAVSWSQ